LLDRHPAEVHSGNARRVGYVDLVEKSFTNDDGFPSARVDIVHNGSCAAGGSLFGGSLGVSAKQIFECLIHFVELGLPSACFSHDACNQRGRVVEVCCRRQ
jgi:hypothetical protein